MDNNNDERNVNLIIKNQEEENVSKFSVSFSGIFSFLKRFCALWIAVTIIVSILSALIFSFTNIKVYKETQALISFSYSGIEKGLDPNGNKFDVNSVKSPLIISRALDDLDYDQGSVETIRKAITIEGIVPQNVMDKITAYKEIIEDGNSSSLSAVEKVLDITYYPTQYRVKFNYADTNYTPQQASALLNKMLECYSEYFLDRYGYNEALGSAVKSLDYTEYDYAQAIDILDSALNTLKTYVNNLKSTDSFRFRSSEKGCTFADLSERISTIQNADLDITSSYITFNVVTKDAEALRTYYNYKIESLMRHETVCRENLAAVEESIKNYEKNTVQIFGAGSDNINTTAKEASAAYDQLFDTKLGVQSDLSSTVQYINLYKSRLERLDHAAVANDQQKAKVEKDLESVSRKIDLLVDDVIAVADEYYKTMVFAKTYNILVPASTSSTGVVKQAVKDSIILVVVLDALIFVVYFGYCVVAACIEENRKPAPNKKRAEKNKESKKQ